MIETSARLLRLLSLLQQPKEWSGAALAEELGVGVRTVRRDVDKLRNLGYPVDAVPGVGGYPLGARGPPPPPLLGHGGGGAVAVRLPAGAARTAGGNGGGSGRAVAKPHDGLPPPPP